jgi:DNA-binding NtrC family response regulator
LITGPSGCGKELAARAVHDGSARRAKKLVSRNAATLPPGLVDAELFGNIADYAHAGLPERPGLVGEADGGTLFLDEIGELSAEVSTHLLRLLAGGDYQRLGDAKKRTADVRVVGATNRDVGELRPDVVARFPLRVDLPGLERRLSDVPLLARHLLMRAAADDVALAERYFVARGRERHPRVSAALVRALLTRRYSTHVREIEAILWRCIEASDGDVIELAPEPLPGTSAARADVDANANAKPREITADDVRASLARHGGVQAKVWKDLGLANRFALRRLMKSFGITSAE